MTNLFLSLALMTNAVLHWEPSPDTSVVSYVVHASPFSRYTNQLVTAEVSPPPTPDGLTSAPVVGCRSVCVGTNLGWHSNSATITATSGTNWTIAPGLENARLYYAVTAVDDAGIESDLSNEVLFNPRWLFVRYVVEGSRDLRDWKPIGEERVLRVWKPETVLFLRALLKTTP